MLSKAFQKRLERGEQLATTKGRFLPECICFPAHEQPRFDLPTDEKIALEVKCPLHGDRFVQFAQIYVARWLREKEEKRWLQRSEQFHKAWLASFPNGLSATEEEQEDNRAGVVRRGTSYHPGNGSADG